MQFVFGICMWMNRDESKQKCLKGQDAGCTKSRAAKARQERPIEETSRGKAVHMAGSTYARG